MHIVDVEGSESINYPGIGRETTRYDDDDVAPALGGGLVFEFTPEASAFVGVDVLLGDLYDDTVAGAGFRWSFR